MLDHDGRRCLGVVVPPASGPQRATAVSEVDDVQNTLLIYASTPKPRGHGKRALAEFAPISPACVCAAHIEVQACAHTTLFSGTHMLVPRPSGHMACAW